MPLMSMTGFARSSGTFAPWTWFWEVKSVNARGLDVRLRMPSGLEALEPGIRASIAKRFKRGAFNLSLNLRRDDTEADLVVNENALATVLAALDQLRERGFEDPDPASVLGLRGVLEAGSSEDEESVLQARNEAIQASAEEALSELEASRKNEGEGLEIVLREQIEKIQELTQKAEEVAAAGPDKVRERMKEQVVALLDAGAQFNEDRLAQELAIIAVKADVREEIDRLGVHVKNGLDLLGTKGPVGRKLDFLTQEFNREANTICSKASDINLTQIGLDLKTVIDQVREQVQNVE